MRRLWGRVRVWLHSSGMIEELWHVGVWVTSWTTLYLACWIGDLQYALAPKGWSEARCVFSIFGAFVVWAFVSATREDET